MLRIRAGRFQRPGQKQSGIKHGRFFQETAAYCLSAALCNIRKSGSREIISLVGVWGG
jgi:hypothetical protein